MKELQVQALTECLDEVLDFVNAELEAYDCPTKAQIQIAIAVEEIFVNIAHYAYKPEIGEAMIRCTVSENPLSVNVQFEDSGKPYNPLEVPDPDITLSAEKREIGGLGIFMVKKSMDNIDYEYKEGKNILTIRKAF